MNRSRAAAITAVVAGLGGTAFAYLFFVRTAVGQRLDARLAPSHGVYASDRLLAAYDRHIILTELVVLAFVVAIAARQERLWRGLASAAGPLVVFAAVNVAKDALPRPLIGATGSAHNSFPSGHVGLAAATVLALCLVLPASARGVAAVLGAIAVVLVALATVAAGWHRFSDGLGAILLAVAAAGLVVLVSPSRPAYEAAPDTIRAARPSSSRSRRRERCAK